MIATILKSARELYASAPSHAPSGWMPPDGTYCVITAVSEASRTRNAAVYGEAIRVMTSAIPWASLVNFNAAHSTEEVLAVFDRAIAAESM